MRHIATSLLPLVAALAACVGDTTFCDVAPIVSRHCMSCHATEPRFGAPMSLSRITDFEADGVGTPGERVADLVRLRIHDAVHPMPQVGKMSDAERRVLDAWLDGGRPSGGCDAVPPGVNFTLVEGVEALPCTPDTYITASEAPTTGKANDHAGFEVPVREDTYRCFGVRLPAKAGQQLVAAAPLIGDDRLVHHMILYLDADKAQPQGPHACSTRSDTALPLMMWGPGAGGLVLPGDVGLTLGDGDVQFDLEVHYNNGRRLEGARDRSGFGVCTSSVPRRFKAQVGTLGTTHFVIPPKQDGVDGTLSLTNTCKPEITETVHIMATAPHMHALGRELRTIIQRWDGTTDTLVDVPDFNFNNQVPYPVDVTLEPGDRLSTTCTWRNPHESPVSYGGATANEMCFNFIMYYPAGQIRTPGLPADACVDPEEVFSHAAPP